METVLRERCFESLRFGRAHVPHFDSAAALRFWWENGGEEWFGSGVNEYAQRPQIVIPPEARHTLALETTPNIAIAPLLCRRFLGWRACVERLRPIRNS